MSLEADVLVIEPLSYWLDGFPDDPDSGPGMALPTKQELRDEVEALA